MIFAVRQKLYIHTYTKFFVRQKVRILCFLLISTNYLYITLSPGSTPKREKSGLTPHFSLVWGWSLGTRLQVCMSITKNHTHDTISSMYFVWLMCSCYCIHYVSQAERWLTMASNVQCSYPTFNLLTYCHLRIQI